MYFPGKARRANVDALLDETFPADRPFEEDSHRYVNGVRWIGADAILIKRFGPFDASRPGWQRICRVL